MSGKLIIVAGAGGNIGSHLTQSLARMPEVDRVILIDRDTYEARNLVNQDILPRDVGQPKVFVQARRLKRIRPRLDVVPIHAPLESLPAGAWRADLIAACLDSRAARQIVNERAWRMGVPWVDSGVMASECLARVNVHVPSEDAPCLECAWSEEDYRLIESEYPCAGGANATAPTGAPAELGALAAAMLAIECRKMLAGETECAAVASQVTLNARRHRHQVTSFRRNARCRFDHKTWRIEPLRGATQEMRIADLLSRFETVSVPGDRFVRRLFCPACRAEKRLFRLASSLDAAARKCDQCGRAMVTPGFDIVERFDRDLPDEVRNRTIGEAGLRRGDIIWAGDRHFEIVTETVMSK